MRLRQVAPSLLLLSAPPHSLGSSPSPEVRLASLWQDRDAFM
jgi:hypothetical protein